ncbi:MAG: hypothetical protein UE068_06675, partial [Paludibacteraceae bacterium]|nr:hypothetical protein [Paludibacteraceae bacterium]
INHSPIPTPTPTLLVSATVDFVNTGSTNLTTHAKHLTPRVVDPLSLATVVDTKMHDVDRHRTFWCQFIRFIISQKQNETE